MAESCLLIPVTTPPRVIAYRRWLAGANGGSSLELNPNTGDVSAPLIVGNGYRDGLHGATATRVGTLDLQGVNAAVPAP